jgi:hypothetical protein
MFNSNLPWSGNIVDVPISTNGEVSFATFHAGVYTLDVIVNDRLAYESIINIGQQPQQQVNQFINTVNQRTYVFVNGTQGNGTNPIGNGTNPIGNGTNPIGNGTNPIGNGTNPIGNGTSPTLPGTNATEPTEPTPPGTNATEPTEPTPPGTNATEPTPPDGGGGGGGSNQTAFFEPPPECPEGEQLSPDGLNCEPIGTEEPMPVECGEGEELVDGQCQIIPTEDEEADLELEENGDEGGDEGGGDEGGGDEGGGDEGGGDEAP